MSAAIRGDFERLRDRGVASTLAPPEAETEPEAEPVPEDETSKPSTADEPTTRTWRTRLFG